MTKIVIPVELTFSILDDDAAARVNSFRALLGQSAVNAGDLNPYKTLLEDLVVGGNGFDRSSPLAVSNELSRPEFLTIPNIDVIVGLGGDVVGLPVFFQISNKDAICPFSATAETWEAWNSAHHTINQYGSFWYRASTVGQSGEPMKASYWSSLSRANVISVTEFRSIQSQFTVFP